MDSILVTHLKSLLKGKEVYLLSNHLICERAGGGGDTTQKK
jgi:hypothetical protein